MRDLFQVVFELKKKEVEMAKQQLEGKNVTSSLIRHTTSTVTDTKSKVRIDVVIAVCVFRCYTYKKLLILFLLIDVLLLLN